MMNDNLKQQYNNRDRVVRVLSKDKKIRAVAIKNTNAAIVAQIKHKISYIPAALLARHLAAASMMASFLKGEERISIETEGSGPISRIFAEALQVGEVRGFVEENESPENLRLNNLKDIVGLGLMKITKTLYNKPEPIQGIVVLQRGDVSTDLAYYFNQSEQIPTAVALDVDIDDEGKIRQSGGILVQAMPGASRKSLEIIHEEIVRNSPITKLFDENLKPESALSKILPFEYTVLNNSQVDFFCRCSKEKFMGKLKLLGVEEIKDMREQGHDELVCQYCNSHYKINPEEFDKLIHELHAVKN